MLDEPSDCANRYPGGGCDDRLRLIPYGEIRLSRGGELERVGCFGRRQVLDLDSGFFQETFVPCDEQRNVIHVGEPVEHHRQLFRRGRGVNRCCGEHNERQNREKFFHECASSMDRPESGRILLREIRKISIST